MRRGLPRLYSFLTVPHSCNLPLMACVSNARREDSMIRKMSSGKFRLYSKKKNPKTGKRRNLGTFDSRAAAEKHERAVQYYKRAA